MPSAPTAAAVQVPLNYPTALIYVDESAVKASAGRFFVIGAVKVRKPGKLMRTILDIRDRNDVRDEFKFSKISRGKFPVFCELIDALENSHPPCWTISARQEEVHLMTPFAKW